MILTLHSRPPSGNNLYRNMPSGGRALGKKYAAWRKVAVPYLAMQARAAGWPPDFQGRVDVLLTLDVPDKRRRDVDGPIKAALDMLVASGIIQDDSVRFVRQVTARWVEGLGAPAKMEVTAL